MKNVGLREQYNYLKEWHVIPEYKLCHRSQPTSVHVRGENQETLRF